MDLSSEHILVMTRDEIRSIDRAAVEMLGISGLTLMENAARGACDVLRTSVLHGEGVSAGQRILILCGPGNNGGDGLAMARLLAADGVHTSVVLVSAGKALATDTETNLHILEAAGISVQRCDADEVLCQMIASLSAGDVIVDGLLGTGFQGNLREPFHTIVAWVNASPATVLALDIPSGLDCDQGNAIGRCVQAQYTVTFLCRKIGFDNSESQQLTGDVSVAQIGLPQKWVLFWLERRRAAV